MLSVGIDASLKSTGLVMLVGTSKEPVAAMALSPKPGTKIGRSVELRDRILIAVNQQLSRLPQQRVLIAIEGYAKWAKQDHEALITLGAVLRSAFVDRGWPYVEPSPSQVQSYVQFKKPRGLKDTKANQKLLKPHAEVEATWGFVHESGDVIDAYVLAQIAMRKSAWRPVSLAIPSHQLDVLHALPSL